MQRLSAQADEAVHKQHTVSGVLLGHFSEPVGQKGAPQVCSFNLEYPFAKHRSRGLEQCGEAPIEDFVKYASRSMENEWWKVENHLNETIAAVKDEDESIFSSDVHINRIRSLVAIHLSRSIQYAIINSESEEAAYSQAHQFWHANPDWLDAVAQLLLGPRSDSDSGRQFAFEELYSLSRERTESGAIFRVLLESRYRRTRHWLRNFGMEILVAKSGEFLIGDIPALTVKEGLPNAGVASGVGFMIADAIILPLTPKYLARVVDRPSCYVHVSETTVAQLNAWQVTGAFSHVYLRPGSGLEEFVRSVPRPRPSEGLFRDAYRLYSAKQGGR
jgi:hypothetical protein